MYQVTASQEYEYLQSKSNYWWGQGWAKYHNLSVRKRSIIINKKIMPNVELNKLSMRH